MLSGTNDHQKGMVISAMFFGCRVSGEKNGIFEEKVEIHFNLFSPPYTVMCAVRYTRLSPCATVKPNSTRHTVGSPAIAVTDTSP